MNDDVKEQIRLQKWNETHQIIDGKDHKKCRVCNEYLHVSEFYSNKSNLIDGLNPYCKPCTKNRATTWAINNPDKVKDRHKRAIVVDYERRLAHSRKRRKTDDHKLYMTNWRQNNKDKLTEYRVKRQESKSHDITAEEWMLCKEYFDHKCAYCGLSENEHLETHRQQLHKEHVEDEGSNGIENCVPSCRNCNSQKWKYEFNKWYNESNENFTKERLQRIIDWISSFK